MSYTAEISRSNPTAYLFVVDQSGSMQDTMSTGRSKAQQVADVINRTLATLMVRSTKSDGIRDYFHVGVLGYSGNDVFNALQGALGEAILNPMSAIEASPLRIEERKKKSDDGAGGILETSIKFPVWYEASASGGTPMCAALLRAAEELVTWCDAHPDCYPATVLHITDGESTDGDPEDLASQLKQIQTKDGTVLLLNLHLSISAITPIEFPAAESILPDNYAKLLFRMSSQLPEHIIRYAQEKGFNVSYESRGFMFNADAIQIADFFDIGTRASQLR